MRVLSALLCLALLMSAAPVDLAQFARAEAAEPVAEEQAAPEITAAPEPVAAQAPAAVETSVEEEPVETEVPAEAEPAETVAPAEAAPEETAAPERTAEPAETPVPAEGEAPVETALPGQEEIPAATDAAAPGETPVPEFTPAPTPVPAEDPNAIDYAAPASESAAFARGYAEILENDAPLYASAGADSDVKAVLGRGVVFVLERAGADPDRLRVAFNAGPDLGIDTGWLDARFVRPMEPVSEVPAYQQFCAGQEDLLFYEDLAELPLARISCAYPEDRAPAATEAPAVTAAPAPDEVAEGEGHPIVMPEPAETQLPEEHSIVEESAASVPDAAEGDADGEADVVAEEMPAAPDAIPEGVPSEDGDADMLPPEDEPLGQEEIQPEIGQEELQLYAGHSQQLNLRLPEGAVPMLTSSNIKVATVSASGVVTAIAPGEASITLSAGDEVDTCAVSVAIAPVISLKSEELRLGVGEIYDLRGSGFVRVSGDADLTFATSGTCIAVSADGTITAKSAGTATVAITETTGGAHCNLTVTVQAAPASASIPDCMTLSEGMTARLDVAFPANTYASYALTSSDESVVTVDEGGNVTAQPLAGGTSATATITLRTGNGLTDTCAVTVWRAPASISVDPAEIALALGETGRRIEAVARDADGNAVPCEFEYAFVPGATQVVQIGEGGELTALCPGTATITVSAKNAPGAATASCAVSVANKAPSIALRRATITLGVGDTLQLSDGADGLIAIPEGTSVLSYRYSSSRTAYATVSAAGVITAKKAGYSDITITPDGAPSVKLRVNVKKAAGSVGFSASELTVGAGASARLTVTFPSGTYANYSVTSSDPTGESVTVARDGTSDAWIVTAKENFDYRTVTLTVRSSLRGYTDTCAVTVVPGPRPEQVQISAAKETLGVGEPGGKVSAEIDAKARAAGLATGGFTYESSDASKLAVAADGTLTACAASDAPIAITARATVPYAPGAYATATTQVAVVAYPTSFALTQSSLSLGIGDSYSLFDDPDGLLSILPEGAQTSFSYAASAKSNKTAKTSVLTVSADGLIVAKKAGTAYVKITPKSGSGVSAKTLKVVVSKATGAVSLGTGSLRLGVGMSGSLTVGFSSKCFSRFTVENSDSDVIELTREGANLTGLRLKALKPGTSTITVRSLTKGYVDTCAVTVVEAPSAGEISFAAPAEIGVGEAGQSVSASYPADKLASISYSSNNPSLLTVNASTGALTAKAWGELPANATVSVLVNGRDVGIHATVRVLPAPVSMTLNPSAVTVQVGRTYQIDPGKIVQLNEGSRASFSYTASSKSNKIASTKLISVSGAGVITAKKTGTAYVRILTQNKNCYKYLRVNVVKAGSTFALNPATLSLGVGMKGNLTAAKAPAGELSYVCEPEGIVEIDATGALTAKAPGTALVSAKVGDVLSAATTVTVLPAPQAGEIRFAEDSTARISANQKNAKLSASCAPGTMAELVYEIEGTAPAGISINPSTGALTAAANAPAQGSFTVRASDKNHPEVYATFEVQMVPSAAMSGLNQATIQLGVGETIRITDEPGGIIKLATAGAAGSYTFATYKDKKCKTKSSSIASVNATTGALTGKKAGTAYVKITGHAGGSAVLTVKVYKVPGSATLSPAEITLGEGMTGKLTANYPSGRSFASSDPAVAAVSADGTVTAIREGAATIIVTTWNGKSDTSRVRVVKGPADADEIELRVSKEVFGVGEKGGSVSATALNGKMSTFAYSASPESVLRVDSATGALTPVGAGTATVTATAGNTGASVSCEVTVKEAPTAIRAAKTLSLGVGNTYSLTDDALGVLQLTPAGAATKYTYKVRSGGSYATISAAGVITAKKAGTAKIRVTTHTGKYADVTVKVYKLAGSVTLSSTELKLGVGMTRTLAVKFPSKTYANYSLTSSNPSVATVDAAGKVVAVGMGEATITVRTDNGKVDTCHVTVVAGTTAIHADTTPITMGVGEKGISILATPDADALADFTFTSSDTSVLTVNASTGTLTARKASSAKVTVTISVAYNGNVAPVEVPVTVVAAPGKTQISLAQSSIKMGVGDTYQIAEYDPATGDGLIKLSGGVSASYTYKSTKTSVATVSAAGVVTAKKAGTTTIRIYTQNTKIYKDFKVTVVKYTGSMTIAPALTIGAEMTAKIAPTFSSGAYGLVEFTSSDPNVVRVDPSTGALTAGTAEFINAPMQATVTARLLKTNATDTCCVTVVPEPTAIGIDYGAMRGVETDEGGERFLRVGVKEGGVRIAPVCTQPAPSMCDYTYSVDRAGLSVDATGLLSAATASDAYYTVTVAAKSAPGVTTAIKVKVVAAPTGVSFTSGTLSLGVGDVYQLKEEGEGGIIRLSPADASASYSYSASAKSNKISKTSVLTVSSSGVITAKKAGTAYVQVKTQNGKSRVLTVKVYKKPGSISLNPAELTVGELSTGKLSVVYPKSTYSQIASFTSSNPGLLSVDGSGNLRAGELAGSGAAETVTVTATTQSGASASAKVTVLPHPARVDFPQQEYRLSAQMKLATSLALPAGTMAQNFTYTSDDESVAAIDANGVISGINPEGTARSATITVTANPGTKFAVSGTAQVIVDPAPDHISYAEAGLPSGTLVLAKGDTVTIPEPLAYSKSGEVIPATYTYSSNNASYVRVSGNKMTAVKTGKTVTITAKSHNGKTATFKVSVSSSAANKVELYCGGELVNGATLDMYVNAEHPNDILELTAKVSGASVNYGALNFTSDAPAVASVDANGVVTALSEGTATITATAAKGGASAKFTVRVGKLSASLEVAESALTMGIGEKQTIEPVFSDENSSMRLRFVSSAPEVASVDENGTISARAGGTAVITVTGQYGMAAQVDVTVLYNPTAILLPANQIFLVVGDPSFVLKPALIADHTPFNDRVTFASSNADVVEVDAEGNVTVKGEGFSSVSATTYNGLTAECGVYVNEYDEFTTYESGFYWEGGKAIVAGDSAELALGINAQALAEGFEVVSSDPDKLEIVDNTYMHALAAADAVTLELKVGGETVDTCTVKVYESLNLSFQVGGRDVGESVELETANYSKAVGKDYAIELTGLPKESLVGTFEVQMSNPGVLNNMFNVEFVTTETAGETTIKVRTYDQTIYLDVTVLGAPVYRALVITEYNGTANALPFMQANVELMRTTLGASIIGGQKYQIKELKNPSEATIKSNISSYFAGAKKNDVSLIYVAAHGHMGTGSASGQYCFSLSSYVIKKPATYVTDAELMSWIKASPANNGNVLLLVDSCNSGGFISHQQKAGGLKADGNIAVLTAQVANKSASFHVGGGSDDEPTHEFFTRALCRGLGYDQVAKWGTTSADASGDGFVTIQEIFDYARPETSRMATECAKNHFYYYKKSGKYYLYNYGFKAPGVSNIPKRDSWVNSNGGQTPQSFIPNAMKDLVIFGRFS